MTESIKTLRRTGERRLLFLRLQGRVETTHETLEAGITSQLPEIRAVQKRFDQEVAKQLVIALDLSLDEGYGLGGRAASKSSDA